MKCSGTANENFRYISVARRGILKLRECLANIEIATVASEDEGMIKCWEEVWLAYEMGGDRPRRRAQPLPVSARNRSWQALPAARASA
jgi:hypothetical protein